MTIDLALLARLPELVQELAQQLERLQQPDRILKTREAAQLLKIGESQLLTLVHAGTIPHLVLGNGFRFSEQQLLAFVRDQAQQNIRQAS